MKPSPLMVTSLFALVLVPALASAQPKVTVVAPVERPTSAHAVPVEPERPVVRAPAVTRNGLEAPQARPLPAATAAAPKTAPLPHGANATAPSGEAKAAAVTSFPSVAVRDQVRTLRGKTPELESVLKSQAADAHIGKVLDHSKQNGNYYIVSDLHIGLGKTRPNGAFDRQDDFTRPDVFVKTLQHISHQPGNNTLVIGGDFLDILEHVAPEQDIGHVNDAISQMVKGHEVEFKAMAKAVVNDNLHVVYIRGNHDIRLVDSSELVAKKTTVRDHFIGEVAKVAGLNETETNAFKERIGFAGHLAPLGKFGEMLVFHGEQQDPTNSWRNPANPYSYKANGERVIERNIGDGVVQEEWRATEMNDPDADNRAQSAANAENSSTMAVTHNLITNPSSQAHALKFFVEASRRRVTTSEGQELAERIDDRHTLKDWADQTGFANMMNMPLKEGEAPRHLTGPQIARTLDEIYRQMPTPIHEQMTSPLHTVNAARIVLGGGKRTLEEAAKAEPKFLQLLTEKLPNVRYVVWGHDHKERIRVGQIEGKGKTGFLDSSTWTKIDGEDRMNVIVAHTDATGHMKDDPELLRVNQANGVPELQPRAFEERNNVANWGK
jgi:metallophosphoesterase superfamily enzyme